MAVGDDTASAGWPVVPDTGEDGRVRWGAREINRTRDFIAKHIMKDVQPISKGGTGGTDLQQARTNLGFRYGTGDPPTDAPNGTIYFKIL